MWQLDHKEGWAPKNRSFSTVVLKTLESPLDCKEIQPVNPKGNQFIENTNAEAETPILWPPDAKTWLIRKDPDAEKDWRREEKGTDRGGDGWMASLTQWTWVWVSSRKWWWTGKPGVLQFRWAFVGKVMSLLFNKLSRLVITFFPRNKRLLISWLQSPSAVIFSSVQFSCSVVSEP